MSQLQQALVHNIYGDANELISTAPEGVVCIPRGWTPEDEAQLYALMQQEGLSSISCLPAFLFRYEGTIYEIRVADMPKPWSWTAIMQAKESLIEQIENAPEAEE